MRLRFQKKIAIIILTIFTISCGDDVIVNEPRIRHDFNGDGIADVIVGARIEDDAGTVTGSAYVFYGTSPWASSIDASNADVKLLGEALDDDFGRTVSGAGDIDDDGIDDILVGAPNTGTNQGTAYLFYGSATLTSRIGASAANVTLEGEDDSDFFGRSVSGAGDVNGDGIDDMIVGARRDDDGGTDAGAAYIFYGGKLASSIDASAANVKLVGEDGSDDFGQSVSNAGDVNNDGTDDVIVGSRCNTEGGGCAGAAYIFYGGKNLASSIDASAANVKLVGESAYNYLGYSVSNAGDVNNDGIDDVIAGARGTDAGGGGGSDYQGAAYIFYGGNLASSIDASNANVILTAESDYDLLGFSVSNAGDINNDGTDDVIVGADGDDDGGDAAGAAYILYGGNLDASINAADANVKLVGEATLDYFGRGVSGGGDVNNDGIADVIVGAEGDDDGGTRAGALYIFNGSASLASSIDASLADVKLVGEDTDDRLGDGNSGGGP